MICAAATRKMSDDGSSAYESACEFAKKAKTVVHVAWIPLLLWVGTQTEAAPSLLQLLAPPM